MQRAQHKRLPLTRLFATDLDPFTPLPVSQPPYDRFGRSYEACQWGGSSFNAQPTRCAAITGPATPTDSAGDSDTAARQLTGFSFLATSDSRYYAPVALGIWCANWELGSEASGIGGEFQAASGAPVPGVDIEGSTVHHDVDWVLAHPLPLG
jgi:hypothetical protein